MKRSSPNTFSTLLKHKKRILPTNYHHIKTMVKNKICNNKSKSFTQRKSSYQLKIPKIFKRLRNYKNI